MLTDLLTVAVALRQPECGHLLVRHAVPNSYGGSMLLGTTDWCACETCCQQHTGTVLEHVRRLFAVDPKRWVFFTPEIWALTLCALCAKELRTLR